MDFVTFVKTQLGQTAQDLAAHLSTEISETAASMGVDWEESKSAVHCSIVKTVYKKRDGVVGLTSEDQGRVSVIPGIGIYRDKVTSETMEYPIITFTNARNSYLKNTQSSNSKQVASATFHSLQKLYDLFNEFKESGQVPAKKAGVTLSKDESARKRKEKEQKARKALAIDTSRLKNAIPLVQGSRFDHLQSKSVLGVAISLGLLTGSDSLGPYIIYPLQHNNGVMIGAQRVYDKQMPDGNRKICTEAAPTNGAYCILGQNNSYELIYICEGLTTALSVHAATGKPVAIALYNSNLVHVNAALQCYRKRVIVADNDRFNPDDGNSGMYWAIMSVKKHGGFVFCPTPTLGTDANDVHHYDGIIALKAQLENRTHYWTQRECMSYNGLFNLISI